MHSAEHATFGDVGLEISEYVATAEIHRPPHNFFDAGLIGSLADAYEAAAQAGARSIVLCSEGKNFCAGADFTGRSSAGRVGGGGGARELYDAALRLFEAPLPVVAAVQGAAVGGGLGLACSADFRVASPAARFCANFSRLGLHQGFALSATLPAILRPAARLGSAVHRPPGRRRGGDRYRSGGPAGRRSARGGARTGRASSRRRRRSRCGRSGRRCGRDWLDLRGTRWRASWSSRRNCGQRRTSPRESRRRPSDGRRDSRAGERPGGGAGRR